MDVICIIVALAITGLAQLILTIKYAHYKKVEIDSGLTGKEVAEKILKKYDLDDVVTVNEISGNLTDHYNDSNKTVNLSTDIYEGTSIASTAVAAHECGHALQYKYGYVPIKIRNRIVPIVNIGNKLGYIAIVISLAASLTSLFIIGIVLISLAVVFQLITLPCEFNASKRANKVILEMGLIDEHEQKGTKSMLRAAAFTYVAGLFSSILQILRLVYIFSGRRRD
ncbi:MAG: zinc metallopeptidase [Bacilli bacterium]|nr:zinc metallopeptidase [Bacilli bacterium]